MNAVKSPNLLVNIAAKNILREVPSLSTSSILINEFPDDFKQV